ncbi:MAG TPA: hypothetical protein PK711_01910 [Bacteroidales bacterium]|nr:hypothetical protein [Bacteroidales bacterium]HRZ22013.1 hypothetical protein [Bacteroidales bacterium]
MNIGAIRRNRRITLLVIGLAAIAFMVYALAMTLKMPAHEIKRLNQLYSDTVRSESDHILMNDDIFRLRKEESFLRSRLAMAKNDSISLTLDMHDSLLMLELEGVAIHQARVHHIKMSPVFSNMNRSALVQLFDTPFRVDSCRATIVKEPIIVQKAPADTIEAARQETVRDTMPPPPATYHLFLNKDITLIIVQTGELDKKNEIYRQFVQTNLHRKVDHIIRNLARFQVPDYRPWIMVFVAQDDAITTYRAIPYHSLVTVRI